MRYWETSSASETRALGERLVDELLPDGILLLSGSLGAGKTTLVQGLAAGLGLSPRQVQSPSYTLIREHQGSRGRLVHVDLYRLTPGETGALGLDEVLATPGVKAVEWPDRLPFPVPGSVHLRIRPLTGDRRRVEEVESMAANADETNDEMNDEILEVR